MRRVPESGGISPATNSMSVLLPAPVGPTIATTRPLATSSETRSRDGRSSAVNVNASDSTWTPCASSVDVIDTVGSGSIGSSSTSRTRAQPASENGSSDST